jgi:lipooligosaccharide transport system permease protein
MPHSSQTITIKPQSYLSRILAVWFRHARVYAQSFISNALPPFLEPLIFLGGIGLGLGVYIEFMDGIPYVAFLASALPVSATMFTASFETTYGTFIRLHFDKAYDGMLGAPVSVTDLMHGELLWAATKGAMFALAVSLITSLFGATPFYAMAIAPVVGFFGGLFFGGLGLLVTSLVDNINQFNFFFTGLLSPMLFLSGIVFPLSNLPTPIRVVAEILPLTHMARPLRGLILGQLEWVMLLDAAYLLLGGLLLVLWGVHRIKKIMIS